MVEFTPKTGSRRLDFLAKRMFSAPESLPRRILLWAAGAIQSPRIGAEGNLEGWNGSLPFLPGNLGRSDSESTTNPAGCLPNWGD